MAFKDIRREPLQLQFNCIGVLQLLSPKQKAQLLQTDAAWFRSNFLPLIPEQLVEKLYSDKENVRPAKYAISHIAALFFVRLTGLTEEEFLTQLPWNLSYQFALGIDQWTDNTSFGRDTFANLRARFRKYDAEHQGECIIDQITHAIDMNMCKKMGLLDTRYNERYYHGFRLDSLMIGMQATQRPRLDLVYTTISICVSLLIRCELEVPEKLQHFTQKVDRRSVIYYHGTIKEYLEEGFTTDKESVEKMTQGKRKEAITEHRLSLLIPEAIELKKYMEDNSLIKSNEYILLERMISDQVSYDASGNYTIKNKNEIHAGSLQTPYEPEATYRFKAGKGYYGYAGFTVDLFNQSGDGIVVYRSLENNRYSDQKFMEDFLSGMDSCLETSENARSFCSTDAGFVSMRLNQLCDLKHLDVYCAGVHGVAPDTIFADFELSEDSSEILKCPSGYKPDKCLTIGTNNSFRIRFFDKKCANCENKDRCKATITGKTNNTGSSYVDVSESKITAAICVRMRNGEEGEETVEYINKRNAIEGLNGVLRTRYDIDERKVPGIIFARLNFYVAITCYNWTKYLAYCKRTNTK